VTHSSHLQALTDRCVLCGLCSQHCPTYALDASENESPRGRIALLNAANQGLLTLDERAHQHLAHCVGCRACEHFCPSGVQFGEIMDQGRALFSPGGNSAATAPDEKARLLNTILDSIRQPQRLAWFGKWLRRYQRWGVQKVLRASGALQFLGLAERERLLPPIHRVQREWPEYSPAAGRHHGDVALFLGCITRLAQAHTLRATITLLNHLGYGVFIPASQGCCGALHRHNGEIATANTLAITNLKAFDKLKVAAILHTASGCTAQLREYGPHFQDSPYAPKASRFSQTVMDVNAFIVQALARHGWPQSLPLQPLAQTVLVHTPCSLRNVLRAASAPLQLLQNIPQIQCLALAENLGCCGAGGGYLLTQPEFSRQMRNKTLDAIEASTPTPRLLVSSNIGCAMNLSAGLRERGHAVEVLHPVDVLVRQLALEQD
jgi:glycolate oxidase iron-sulfur subunit